MVKRKRSREDDVEQKLADYRKEIFRALKGAKGLERQRYSKRLRDDKATPDKVKRLEREILVLKVHAAAISKRRVNTQSTFTDMSSSRSTSNRPPTPTSTPHSSKSSKSPKAPPCPKRLSKVFRSQTCLRMRRRRCTM